jgi:hypothetical protein
MPSPANSSATLCYVTGRASFLFGQLTFSGGMGSVVDVGGTLLQFNDVPDSALADWLAMRQDWAAVGDDMRRAMIEELEALDPATLEQLSAALRRRRSLCR